jgi:hypothetical protein
MLRPGSFRSLLLATAGLSLLLAASSFAEEPALNKPPSTADWLRLSKLPDWSGVWNPNISDQNAQIKTNPVPWKPEVEGRINQLAAGEKAGRPKGLFVDCLPEAMPSWMLISHNALEILFTPGRVTLLGEADGNRLRRIYTDGRLHPPDLGGDVQWAYGYYNSALARPEDTVPAQAYLNGTLSWTSADDHFVVVLSAKNLLDSQKRVSSSYTPSTGVRFVNFPDPRTFLGTLKYQL